MILNFWFIHKKRRIFIVKLLFNYHGYNELNNTQVNNKFNSLEMLQITSTIDIYLFRMEDLLCKPYLKYKT